MLHQRSGVITGDEQGGETALRETGVTENFLDGEGTAGDVAGMFQHADITRHEVRCRETEHLPEREIPGHDSEHDADGLVGDEALRALGLDRYIGEEGFGMFDIVVADAGAFFDFGGAFLQHFAHFVGHQFREFLRTFAQNSGGFFHMRGTYAEATLLPFAEAGMRGVDTPGDLDVRMRRILFDEHAVGGVDAFHAASFHEHGVKKRY